MIYVMTVIWYIYALCFYYDSIWHHWHSWNLYTNTHRIMWPHVCVVGNLFSLPNVWQHIMTYIICNYIIHDFCAKPHALAGFVRPRKRKRSCTSRGQEPRRMKRSECCWLWRSTCSLRALMEWRVVIQTRNWEEEGYRSRPHQEFELRLWVDSMGALCRDDAGMLVEYCTH